MSQPILCIHDVVSSTNWVCEKPYNSHLKGFRNGHLLKYDAKFLTSVKGL